MSERPKLSIMRYRTGMYIVLAGTHDTERFFIIHSGMAILSSVPGGPVFEPAVTLNAGDFFGVVSAMAQKKQLETVQAVSDVTLLAVNRLQFEGLIQFNTPIAMKIIQQFSRTIRNINSQLTHLTFNSPDTKDAADALVDTAAYYNAKQKYKIAAYAYKRFTECYPTHARIKEAANSLAALPQNSAGATAYQHASSPFLRQYDEDVPVFVEGEQGDDLFVIQSGSVKIIKVIDKDEVILALLKPGDIFGEMAILESKPRSANAIAFEKTTLMVIQKRNFEKMAATQPQIISRLTRLLAERIWFGYKQLENASIRDPAGRCYDYLLLQLERNNVTIQPHGSYTFNFGPEELAKMVLVPDEMIQQIIHDVMKNAKLSTLGENKLHVPDVTELIKLSDFYKKNQMRAGVRPHRQP